MNELSHLCIVQYNEMINLGIPPNDNDENFRREIKKIRVNGKSVNEKGNNIFKVNSFILLL